MAVIASRAKRSRAVRRLAALLATMALLAGGPADAEPKTYPLPEETAALKPGPGVEAAQNNCLSCHSADYVTTQPPHMGAKFWEAEVAKMIKFGAPISQEDARAIVEYLAKTY